MATPDQIRAFSLMLDKSNLYRARRWMSILPHPKPSSTLRDWQVTQEVEYMLLCMVDKNA
jgi:hypothetical protein